MSYIANGCNDCSTVDFGTGMGAGSMGQLGGGGYGNGSGHQLVAQETVAPQVSTTANPYMYQQTAAPEQQVAVAVQQPQVRQAVQQKPAVKVAPQVPVAQPKASDNQTGKSLQGTVAGYFTGSNFAIMVAFLVASAWHETIKYYINQSIKFNGGTPTYYIVYAVVATLASIFLSSMQ